MCPEITIGVNRGESKEEPFIESTQWRVEETDESTGLLDEQNIEDESSKMHDMNTICQNTFLLSNLSSSYAMIALFLASAIEYISSNFLNLFCFA